MVEHGGNLLKAAKHYGIAPRDWLDLSTGINPNGWLVPQLPADCWQRLPEEDDGLLEVAREYYGCDALLAVSGSQSAIQALPWLRAPCHVGVLSPAYEEYRLRWTQAGHQVLELQSEAINSCLNGLDTLVIINPNNPTSERFSTASLLSWHQRLASRGGWLVVDEAFIDATPESSLSQYASRPGLIILRSLGKFFGLAGIRCGFVLADVALLDTLGRRLGPWTVNHPARIIAKHALADTLWQKNIRIRLAESSARLYQMLDTYGLLATGNNALFQWVKTSVAKQIHESLAKRGILVRLFTNPSSLRFGLPGNASAWRRLESGLAEVMRKLVE